MPEYRVKVKHDQGSKRFVVFAPNKKQVRETIMAVEGCPERAILSVTNTKRRVVLIDTGVEVIVCRTAPSIHIARSVGGSKWTWMDEFTNGTDAMEWCKKKGYSFIVINLSER
jgi:hypothetical protein